ncbi:two-component regulator propeller domain-containing protein [Aquimarina addita]|uniref:histidine kinase n=1 Tax=Aquimarina addita TaxID=870485 RepID=A0ABP7XFY6_9FLAO
MFNKFIHISTPDGLSQSSVIAIEQDKLGQIWIGTRDGLNKYDGDKITIYRNIPNDSTSISNNDILSIQEDAEGFIWIGTYHGLNRYDPKLNSFTSYFRSNQKGAITDNTIWKIHVMKNGELWIGTSNGLMVYDKINDSFIPVKNKSSDNKSISNDHILDIYQDHDETIWIGTANGLNKLIKREAHIFQFERFLTNESEGGLSDGYIQKIIEDEKGIIWIGTKHGGLNKSNTYKDSFTRISNISDEQSMDNDVRSMGIDLKGNLWIATYDGLFIKDQEDKIIRIKHQEGNPKSLSRNTLKTLFVDKKGSVWIGTYYGGLNIWDTSNSNFISIYKNGTDGDIEYGVVSSIVQDQHGKIYFGTEGKGVSVLDTNNKSSYLTSSTGKNLPGTNIKSLFLHQNKLWIGTYNAGIAVYDLLKKDFDSRFISSELQSLLEDDGVYAIQKIEQHILLGTFGSGLVMYDLETKKHQFISNNPSDTTSLTDQRIRAITVDHHKNLWIGTQNGLNLIKNEQFDKNNFSIQRFFYNEEQRSGDDILSIFETYDGDILIGTKASGILIYNGVEFERLKLHVPNTQIHTVYGIVEDDNAALWISSNQGIVNYDPKTKKSILYNQTDGLMRNEFNNNACLKRADGSLFFGGPSGVSYLNPNSIEKNRYAPKVILTGFKVQGEEVQPAGKNSILTKNISYIQELTLDHDQASFAINFSIPNFINATNNQYQYRLKGLEDNRWLYTKNTEVNYTIQKSGTYQFEVKGATSDNIWNETPTVLTIHIKPTPWLSTWAFIGYGLGILLVLIGLNQLLKVRRELKYKLELEHLESTRIKEMNQSKLNFFTNISHEFRTPLALILGPLQQLIENYEGTNKMYKKLLVIERNADQLLILINQLLDFRKFEDKHLKLQAAEGNLVKFLKEIFLSFDEFAKLGKYTYTFESTADVINLYYDRYKLERVFFNLISNAFKYTPEGGKIEVAISLVHDYVSVEIRDNGKGIDQEFVDKVFDRFYEIAGGRAYQKHFNQGSGIGLSIVKKAVYLHKGKITVRENEDKGTIFTVQLLLGKAHLDRSEIINDFKISDDISQYKAQIPKNTSISELDLDSFTTDEKKPVILIAEDNDELRSFIKDLLKEFYQVEEAENGAIAFKKALQKSPDLIISDVIMPKMEGTTLCSKIKGDIRTSHIPFILLTSRTSLVYKVDGLASGADAYISKPFNVKEFMLIIKNLLISTERLKEKFSSGTFDSNDFTVTSVDEQLLKKAIRIVEENIDNSSFDIPFFSSELGVSRTMLFTKIKGWAGLTPNDFIHSIRMKRATQLLELGQINISEVCYKVGFRNPKYFTKCFKKHYNQTPSEYAAKFYKET